MPNAAQKRRAKTQLLCKKKGACSSHAPSQVQEDWRLRSLSAFAEQPVENPVPRRIGVGGRSLKQKG
jgi:hypothetical protein